MICFFLISTQCISREWCDLDSGQGESREISSGDLDAGLDSIGCEFNIYVYTMSIHNSRVSFFCFLF